MDWHLLREGVSDRLDQANVYAQQIPGSSIALRYIKSSYQNDPVRSAIELFLFLFAVRYLLRPSYSVPKHKGFVDLTEDVGALWIDSLGRPKLTVRKGNRRAR